MKRLPVLDRLVLMELNGPFWFGAMMFTTLFFASTNLFSLAEYMVKGASPWTILQMIGLSIPSMIVKTFPMAMLLASLLAFGRLSGESELVATYSAGISLYRSIRPVVFAGLAVSLVTMAINETVVPPAAREMWRLKTAVVKQVGVRVDPVQQKVVEDKKLVTSIIAQGGVDLNAGMLYDVTATQFDMKDGVMQPAFMVFARRARWLGGQEWDLEDGWWLTSDGRARGEFKRTSTRLLRGGINKSLQQIEADLFPDPDTRSFRETLARIQRYRATNDPTSQLEVELWTKIALPIASLIFGVVGAPLAVRRQRGTPAAGFALSIVVIFLYWSLSQYLFILGKNGTMNPMLAAFLPDILGITAGGFFLWNKAR